MSQRSKEFSRRSQTYLEVDGAPYYQAFDLGLEDHFQVDPLFELHGENIYRYGKAPSHYGYQVSLDRLEELQSRKIRPLATRGVLVTPYDALKNPVDNFFNSLGEQVADQSSLGLIYRLLKDYRFDLILPIFLLLLTGASYYLEFQNGQHLAFLYTLPQTPRDIFHSKLRASGRRILQGFTFFLGLVMTFGGLKAGFGQANLPIIRYLKYTDQAQVGSNFQGTHKYINKIAP